MWSWPSWGSRLIKNKKRTQWTRVKERPTTCGSQKNTYVKNVAFCALRKHLILKGYFSMDDPFSPLKPKNMLAALLSKPYEQPPTTSNAFGRLAALSESPLAWSDALLTPPPNRLSTEPAPFARLVAPSDNVSGHNALSAVSTPSLTALLSAYGPLSPQLPTTGLGRALSAPAVKRKVYFAFRFKDIMRVSNVRQSGKIGFDEDKNPRDFYDRSMGKTRDRRSGIAQKANA